MSNSTETETVWWLEPMSAREAANAAWNNLNFALSSLALVRGVSEQAMEAVRVAQNLCDRIVMTDKSDLLSCADSRKQSSLIFVSLGDLYADRCVTCGGRAEYGIASQSGPEGCVEAIRAGRVYCEEHLKEQKFSYER